MPSMEEARQYYEKHNKNPRLSLKTFYGRVHAFGWSYEKALSYPVKFLKLQKDLIIQKMMWMNTMR